MIPIPPLNLTSSASSGPVSTGPTSQRGGGGFNVVYNTGALSGGSSMVAMLAIGAAGLVVVYLLARR